MTITLSPEIERALTEEAVELGKTSDELVTQLVTEKYPVRQETPEKRRARIYSLMGSMAHLGPSHILEDRAEEVAQEEKRFWRK